MENRRPLVRRIAGPIRNPNRDFSLLPPLPPPARSTRVYGTKGRNGVRQPLAELLARDSEAGEESGPDPQESALVTMSRRCNPISSDANTFIVNIPPLSLEKTAVEEDELGLVLAGIRRRHPGVEPAPRTRIGVLHTMVADELGLIATKQRRP
ncbi:hypothetical protein IWW39_001374 [Coemansia spiralis]|uniref:Uncharacterized protein n=1 Tax=Coemansia spiralis TaxID=417178 RepID=A0A9W8GIY7_9FUNG|nr:hypothetical protein IWW39_001374 [Coemansia spiralis]